MEVEEEEKVEGIRVVAITLASSSSLGSGTSSLLVDGRLEAIALVNSSSSLSRRIDRGTEDGMLEVGKVEEGMVEAGKLAAIALSSSSSSLTVEIAEE